MLRAGVGMSTDPDGRAAAESAAAAALGGLRDAAAAGPPDFAIMFATLAYPQAPQQILDSAAAVLGTRAIVGASAHGVLAAGLECEASPSVAVLTASGLNAEPFLLEDLRGHEAAAGTDLAARLAVAPRPEDLVVLLPDPHLDIATLVGSVQQALAPAQVVGAGAGDPVTTGTLQWADGRMRGEALAGAVLHGGRAARVGVTQACRPATEVLTVTRAQGNWILELDGKPALDVYRDTALGPLADDLARAAAFLLVAFPRDPAAPLRPGGYLVRHVVGFSTANRAFAVPQEVRRGQSVALALREPTSAREDLKAMLAAVASDEGGPGQGSFGLYFNCCARGEAFFGVGGLESAYLESALGDTPVAGMFGSCEIGPIGHAGAPAELLTYTGVLALVG